MEILFLKCLLIKHKPMRVNNVQIVHFAYAHVGITRLFIAKW